MILDRTPPEKSHHTQQPGAAKVLNHITVKGQEPGFQGVRVDARQHCANRWFLQGGHILIGIANSSVSGLEAEKVQSEDEKGQPGVMPQVGFDAGQLHVSLRPVQTDVEDRSSSMVLAEMGVVMGERDLFAA